MPRTTRKMVIDGAIEFLSRSGAFTSEAYFVSRDGSASYGAGEHVAQACAIGGIEQALWRLTGEQISRTERDTVGREVGVAYPLPKSMTQSDLYASTMKHVNRVARRLYGGGKLRDADGSPSIIHNIEDVTLAPVSRRTLRRRVLNVLQTASDELR